MAGSNPMADMLAAALGDKLLSIGEDRAGTASFVVDRGAIQEACRLLRDCEEKFVHLSGLWGIDYLGMGLEPRYAVVYYLYSPTSKRRLALKVPVEESDPVVPSIVDIFPGANWHERETFDMFGIRFDGHPNLERILMPDDATEFPLRKDFPLGEEEIEFSHNTERWQKVREHEYPQKSQKRNGV